MSKPDALRRLLQHLRQRTRHPKLREFYDALLAGDADRPDTPPPASAAAPPAKKRRRRTT